MLKVSVPKFFSRRLSALFINRNFAFLWLGQVISLMGDTLFSTTLVLWITTSIVRGQPWAPLALTGLLLTTLLPSLSIGSIAGVFVDRWERRRTMLRMDGLRALLIGVLLIASRFFPSAALPTNTTTIFWQLGTIYLLVFLSNVCSQFFTPSLFALTGDIVPQEHMAHAIGLNQLMTSVSVILGPPLAALLFFTVGVEWALFANALSFVCSFFCLLALRGSLSTTEAESRKRSILLTELYHGLRFFFKESLLRTILITILLIVLGSTALNMLAIFFLEQNLHMSADFYGLYTAAAGAGAIVSSLFASKWVKRFGAVRMLWLTPLCFGMTVLCYARLTAFLPGLVFMFLLGMPGTVYNVAANPLILQVTPRNLIGRVLSVFTPTISLISILSTLGAGYLSSVALVGFHKTLPGVVLGPIDTIFTGIGILGIVAALFALISLRKISIPLPQKEEQRLEAGQQLEAEAIEN